MRLSFLAPSLLVLAFAASVVSADTSSSQTYPLSTYAALGSSFARDSGLPALGWTEEQFNAFVEGMRASVRGQPYPSDEQTALLKKDIEQRLRALAEEYQRRQLDFTQPGRLDEFMKSMAKQHSLQMSDSGLAYGLMPGRGPKFQPAPEDTVVLSCEALGPDGKTQLPKLRLSEQRVVVESLIPGLAEGVQMMTPGSSAIFIVPPDLSFDETNWPEDLTPGSPIIYMVRLHEIVSAP